jgi:hypothetical protein
MRLHSDPRCESELPTREPVPARDDRRMGDGPGPPPTTAPVPPTRGLGATRRAPVAIALLIACACGGDDAPAGAIRGARRDAAVLEAEARAQASAREGLAVRLGSAARDRRILFGDLHVHTTYSIDAYLYGLPIFGGEGAHPPSDACDFARHCAGLDFFSLNDHAEGLTPERWRRSIESVRQCNARAGDPADPDLVAYMGWEWTQTGITPAGHFGHKNVIFPGLGDDELPARPISALPDDAMGRARFPWLARIAEAVASVGAPAYADFLWWIRRLASLPLCERGVDSRELPSDCQENAPTPELLFEKLAQWGLETLVIPHGLTWGIHAPPGAQLDVQLTAARHAPDVQRLLEVYSGHGSAEVYDGAAARANAAARRGECAAKTADFLPCCWRAGEIVRSRCEEPDSPACAERVAEARRLALEAGRRPFWVLPDASVEDWLDCDQSRGAFKPAMSGRPGQTAQYGLAISSFDERVADGGPRRFRFGLIGSSDIHSARAGSGYKQVARKGMSDARGFASPSVESWLSGFVKGEAREPGRARPSPPEPMGFRSLLDVERAASFLYPGGLVAVHARGRDRRSIWEALVRREVYGTSGPRILLWFELTNAPDGPAPMGSEVRLSGAPRFEVRAVGSRIQRPGCPRESAAALPDGDLERLCLGECHHPGDARHAIAAIEVVRIRPQVRAGEPVEGLIEDPWRRFPCDPDPAGCRVRFEDPDFAASGREAVYYVRALQQSTPAVNGANLRTTFDADGNAVAVKPCFGGHRTPRTEDCLAPVQERAWSSPIFARPR